MSVKDKPRKSARKLVEFCPSDLVSIADLCGKQTKDFILKRDELDRLLKNVKLFSQDEESDEDSKTSPKRPAQKCLENELSISISHEDKIPSSAKIKSSVATMMLQPTKVDSFFSIDSFLKSRVGYIADQKALLESLPLHEGNSWCDLSITCNDYLRIRAPFYFYQHRFDKLSKVQRQNLEDWQVEIHEHCEKQRLAMQYQMELCKSFYTSLGSIGPKCWQTGLVDMGQTYAYRWKEMISQMIGHGNHDRNSSRVNITRFTIPFVIHNLEGLSPMQYLTKYCILSLERQSYYQRIFTRNKDIRTHLISVSKLMEALNALMCGTFTKEQNDELISVLDLIEDPPQQINMQEFSFIAAFAERLYYTKNLRIFGEEGLMMQQGLLERSDLDILCKRIEDIRLTKQLTMFFKRLGIFK